LKWWDQTKLINLPGNTNKSPGLAWMPGD